MIRRLTAVMGVTVLAMVLTTGVANAEPNCYTPLSCLLIIGPFQFDDIIGGD